MQAHESIANFASAYSLGITESAAALNLLNKIPPAIKMTLATLVRTQPGFQSLFHDYLTHCLKSFSYTIRVVTVTSSKTTYSSRTYVELSCSEEIHNAKVCDARGNSLWHSEFAPLFSSWGNPPLATQFDQLRQALGFDGASDGERLDGFEAPDEESVEPVNFGTLSSIKQCLILVCFWGTEKAASQKILY